LRHMLQARTSRTGAWANMFISRWRAKERLVHTVEVGLLQGPDFDHFHLDHPSFRHLRRAPPPGVPRMRDAGVGSPRSPGDWHDGGGRHGYRGRIRALLLEPACDAPPSSPVSSSQSSAACSSSLWSDPARSAPTSVEPSPSRRGSGVVISEIPDSSPQGAGRDSAPPAVPCGA
jgi:hypothetical protein